jgi:prefoldin subunit 5
VALAAIQGLTREIEALQAEQMRLSARIAAREMDRRR